MVAEGVFVTGLLDSYCSVDDVRRLLAGHDLSGLGSDEEIDDRIAELLAVTRSGVDAEAGRDFLYHGEDELAVDGSGSDTLSLGAQGISPILGVNGLRVGGIDLRESEYAWYEQEGTLRLRAGARCGQSFARGAQNIQVALDWGHARAPEDIALAQAKLLAAQLLSDVTSDSESIESVTLGDYSVRYSPGGEHGSVIGRWLADAVRTARSYRGVRLAAV